MTYLEKHSILFYSIRLLIWLLNCFDSAVKIISTFLVMGSRKGLPLREILSPHILMYDHPVRFASTPPRRGISSIQCILQKIISTAHDGRPFPSPIPIPFPSLEGWHRAAMTGWSGGSQRLTGWLYLPMKYNDLKFTLGVY